ncbi:MAG: hypothetical protein ACREPJ_06050 [Rhodanobacteraceae bacterium]
MPVVANARFFAVAAWWTIAFSCVDVGQGATPRGYIAAVSKALNVPAMLMTDFVRFRGNRRHATELKCKDRRRLPIKNRPSKKPTGIIFTAKARGDRTSLLCLFSVLPVVVAGAGSDGTPGHPGR